MKLTTKSSELQYNCLLKCPISETTRNSITAAVWYTMKADGNLNLWKKGFNYFYEFIATPREQPLVLVGQSGVVSHL